MSQALETKPSTLGALLAAYSQNAYQKQMLSDIGNKMFVMYTQHGLPPDMFMDAWNKREPLPKSAWLVVISEYYGFFLEHRRKSGLSEKYIDKVRRNNREAIQRFIESGELGEY